MILGVSLKLPTHNAIFNSQGEPSGNGSGDGSGYGSGNGNSPIFPITNTVPTSDSPTTRRVAPSSATTEGFNDTKVPSTSPLPSTTTVEDNGYNAAKIFGVSFGVIVIIAILLMLTTISLVRRYVSFTNVSHRTIIPLSLVTSVTRESMNSILVSGCRIWKGKQLN